MQDMSPDIITVANIRTNIRIIMIMSTHITIIMTEAKPRTE